MLVQAWLPRAAAAHPARTAIETPSESLSYRELLADARAGAEILARRGADPGQRVAIALPGGVAFARALHACLLLGAVAVPVDVRLAATERERVAAGATVLVEEPLVKAAPRVAAGRVEGGAGHAQATHDLDATAVVMHTSGTTSVPRPVELTYGNVLWSALGSAAALGVARDERWLCALPLSHVGGLSILLRSVIYATTAVVHERFETDRALDALHNGQVSVVSMVATTLGRLLDAGLTRPPSLRLALTGGGPVPATLVARARDADVPVSLTYGLTEACSQVTTVPAAALDREAHNAGPPLFCTRLRIDHDGEIMVAGPTVARGSSAPDGWLHTGDLGALDRDGGLLVTGRKDDTIVTGGENVAPVEVEAVLEAHPQVLEAAVLGRADAQWGEAVTAIVVGRPGAELQGDALRAHCAARLAPYKVPKRIDLVRGPLPRTRSGKLCRSELP